MLRHQRILRFQSAKSTGAKAAASVQKDRLQNASRFAHEKTGAFSIARPELQNPYTSDALLTSYITRHCPGEFAPTIESDLTRFGERIITEVDQLGIECEQNPPRLERTDAWGKRVDDIWVTPAWHQQHRVSAEEGLIAIGYERDSAEFSRVHQMAKNLMYGPSSGLYNCPLAMTDGAAMIAQSQKATHPCLERAYDHLTSRDPNHFWSSGQWMTEKRGGSDVGAATDTHAVINDQGKYELHGYKWFTSAITSDMTLTLARINDADGRASDGSRGLSMFYVELRDEDKQLNGIQVHKLKNKLGTKQLPTAELILSGTKAELIGEPGRGIKLISGMLTITRIHNAIAACSFMRRMNHLARDYATKRHAFGTSLHRQPAHVGVLARMEIESRAAMLLSLEVSRLHGRIETGLATEHEKDLMRLLTPLAKLVTGKQTVAVCSEGLECFGGQGYIEDTHIPKLLRDAQVLPIWEGTSTVMSFDVLRAIQTSKGTVIEAIVASMSKMINIKDDSDLGLAATRVNKQLGKLISFVKSSTAESMAYHLKSSRDFSFAIGRLYQACLLVDHANYTQSPVDIYAAQFLHFATTNLVALDFDYSAVSMEHEFNLVYGNYEF